MQEISFSPPCRYTVCAKSLFPKHHSFSFVSSTLSVLFLPVLCSVFTTPSVLFPSLFQFCIYHSFCSVSTIPSLLFLPHLRFRSQPETHALRDRRPSTAACPACWAMGSKPNEPTKEGPLSFVLFDSPFTLSFDNQQGPPLSSLSVPTLLPFRFYHSCCTLSRHSFTLVSNAPSLPFLPLLHFYLPQTFFRSTTHSVLFRCLFSSVILLKCEYYLKDQASSPSYDLAPPPSPPPKRH